MIIQKKIIIGLLVGIFLINLVYAETLLINGEVKTISETKPQFNFLKTFLRKYQFSTFSIIGDERGCSATPTKVLKQTISSDGGTIDINCEQLIGGNCLIDLFKSDSGWNYNGAIGEYKNELNFIRLKGDEKTYYLIEIYSCPNPECSQDFQCELWYGEGSECKTSFEEDSRINYHKNSWNFCTNKDVTIDCFFVNELNACEKRTYHLNYCPSTYLSKRLFDSKSVCEDNIQTEPPTQSGEKTSRNLDDLENIPSDDLLNSLCTSDKNCVANSKCTAISELKERGFVTDISMRSLRKNLCSDEPTYEKIIKFIFPPANFIDITDSTCGLWASKKDTYFQNNYGICIEKSDLEEPSSIDDFIKNIGRKIKLTGNPKTDGYIVLGLFGFLILFVLTRFMIYSNTEFIIMELNKKDKRGLAFTTATVMAIGLATLLLTATGVFFGSGLAGGTFKFAGMLGEVLNILGSIPAVIWIFIGIFFLIALSGRRRR